MEELKNEKYSVDPWKPLMHNPGEVTVEGGREIEELVFI